MLQQTQAAQQDGTNLRLNEVLYINLTYHIFVHLIKKKLLAWPQKKNALSETSTSIQGVYRTRMN